MLGSQDRMSDVREDLTNVRNDLARLADTVSRMVLHRSRDAQGSVRGAVDQAREQVYGRAEDITKAGAMLTSEARDRLLDYNAEFENRIERNPIRAVLIAAGIGLVLGLLSRSR
jgi:ElaB/YqjD/DUF883 family membrane-anchored ribosome-binding protein